MHKKVPNIFTFISDFKKEKILNLNKNIGIIFRNYREENNKYKILKIKQFCKSNNRRFYLANNIRLAMNLNLDGAYIPSFIKNLGIKNYNLKKNFLIMGSAHNIYEIKQKEKQGIEILFLSPLFKTKNYKNELGIIKFNFLSHLSKKKIIALGGINKKNIKKLKLTNIYGFSGISYFLNNF
tara:strand:- start:2561 stop:3103 length:543 start_codon:yes stop_codon:yes gene_type:complete